MIKYILASLFIFSQILWATNIKFSKDILLSNDLKQEITNYWKDRGEEEFKKTYSQELPYLQYIHSKEWYRNFFRNAPSIALIKVEKIKKSTDKSYILAILLYFKYNPKSPTFLYDKWIKIDGKWYHKYDDNPLPM